MTSGSGWKVRKTEAQPACREAWAALSADSCGGPVLAGPEFLSRRGVRSPAANRAQVYSSQQAIKSHQTQEKLREIIRNKERCIIRGRQQRLQGLSSRGHDRTSLSLYRGGERRHHPPHPQYRTRGSRPT